MITKNHRVTLAYELRGPNEDLIEANDEHTPLEFICGHGQTLANFEMNLLGLNAGDPFDFRLPAAQAYGEYQETMIVEVPRDIFQETDQDPLTVGAILPVQDSIGRQLSGAVRKIDDNTVTLDFNHPLSGLDLHFTGKILRVRAATDQELRQLSKCGGCHSCGNDRDCCH
jgi:FKBP-type peptidyl-prolyl cis-trans isomerase SlyD